MSRITRADLQDADRTDDRIQKLQQRITQLEAEAAKNLTAFDNAALERDSLDKKLRDATATLREAGKDTERLDWYIMILWVLEMDHRGWYMRDPEDDSIIAGFWKTPREAIDAAIAKEPK